MSRGFRGLRDRIPRWMLFFSHRAVEGGGAGRF